MNETEIPTPRTDAFFKRRIELYHHGLEPQDTMRDADFARQLERENAAMREVIKAAYEALEESAAKLAGWHGLYETQIGSDDYAAVLNAESIIAKLKPYLP
jgi:hypothetical protein